MSFALQCESDDQPARLQGDPAVAALFTLWEEVTAVAGQLATASPWQRTWASDSSWVRMSSPCWYNLPTDATWLCVRFFPPFFPSSRGSSDTVFQENSFQEGMKALHRRLKRFVWVSRSITLKGENSSLWFRFETYLLWQESWNLSDVPHNFQLTGSNCN